MKRRLLAFAAGAICSLSAFATDVVVCRVGDGVAALSTQATAVFLERRASSGNSVGTIAMPIAVNGANQPITLGGSATSEGALAVSADGNYLTLAGYAATPGTASVSSSASATINRVVARIDALGTVDTSSRLNTAFNASNVRSAVSVDGSAFWVGGNGTAVLGGVWYLTLGVTGGTLVLDTPANSRIVNISSGQLFGSSGSSLFIGVFTVGTGLPTTSGQSATVLAALEATAQPYAFVFFDRSGTVAGLDTLYVADDSNLLSGGGIQKWTFNGSTWTLSTTFTGGLSTGVRGLTGEVVGANVVLYASTDESNANTLVRIVDDGSVSPQATVIATAPANTAYRGVAMAWRAPAPDVIYVDGFD